MKRILKSWLINTIALWLIDYMFSGISFTDFGSLLATGLLLGLLNATVKPLLKLISLPVTFLTLGLFSLVINALVMELAFHLIGGTFLSSFGTAFWASIVLSIVNGLLGAK